MSDYLFNAIRYKFFASLLKAPVTTKIATTKSNKSCEWIVKEHRIGRIQNKQWIYTSEDRNTIIQLAKDQLKGRHILYEAFPEKESRVINATEHSQEKINAYAVSKDFVLINTLNTLRINQQCLDTHLFDSLGLYINADSVNSFEHQYIVFVENLSVMANLKHLTFSENTKFLKNALWLYRGDIKAEQSTGRAYEFFRSLQGKYQLVCFSDFDPEGLRIALTCGASHFLAPSSESLKSFKVKGAEVDYFNQIKAKRYLDNIPYADTAWNTLYDAMQAQRKTIKQEHIISHHIPLMMFDITEEN